MFRFPSYRFVSLVPTCLLCLSMVLIKAQRATAQIVPDSTLDAEQSVVRSDVFVDGNLSDLIEGGAARDGNLFHSFLEFNVGEEQRVYFANPSNIDAIISRVTGDRASSILGRLGVIGTADLFLINPNGLVFGERAELDIEGSFYGTTAEAIALGDGVFSATNPGESSLLAVSPSIAFSNYLSDRSGDIIVQGQLSSGEDIALAGRSIDWQQARVEADGNLSLIATDTLQIQDTGNVSFDTYEGASLYVVAGGAVEIGTITITDTITDVEGEESDRVDANSTGSDSTRPDRPTIDIRSGVNPAAINALSQTTGEGTDSTDAMSADVVNADITIGDIRLAAENGQVLLTNQYEPNLALSEGSIYVTGEGLYGVGIDAQGVDGRQGGEVYLDSRQNIVVTDSQIATVGPGEVGDIVLTADETVAFEATDSTRKIGAFSGLDIDATGTGGDVRIVARNFTLTNSASIGASTGGIGNAGNISISVEETANLQGVSEAFALQAEQSDIDTVSSGLFSGIRDTGEGKGGRIEISARRLDILNGARISTNNFGVGDAGSIRLNIQENARIEGADPFDESASGVFSDLQVISQGQGGDIEITARDLQVLGGARLSTSTFGRGDAGNIILNIEETARFEGSIPGSSTMVSSATSRVARPGQGNGGSVKISARNLQVLNGARLSTSTSGRGDAGNIVLNIQETARFEGSVPVKINPEPSSADRREERNIVSGAFSRIDRFGEGNGGNVQVNARNLELIEGAALSAATFGIGDAGDVTLTVEQNARIEGIDPDGNPSGVFSSVAVSGVGTGGNVEIEAGNLYLTDGGIVTATSQGVGDAGDVVLNIDNRLEALNGSISTSSAFDSGGQLQITAGNILLTGNSDIRTSVDSGANDGGDITVTANTLIALDDSDILAFAADGRGGDIDLSRTTYFGEDAFREDGFSEDGSFRDSIVEDGIDGDRIEGDASRSAFDEDPSRFDDNGRTDINATGGIASGRVAVNDSAFIENSLSQLSDNLFTPEIFVSNRCVAQRRERDRSTFISTNRDSLPQQPGSSQSRYRLGEIQTQPDTADYPTITEPQDVYQLADGRLVLGRECDPAQ